MIEQTHAHAPLLPAQFGDLESFARDWSIEREEKRVEKRLASSMEQIRSFYDAIMPRMDDVLAHLGAFSLEDLPEPETRLLWLTLSLAEISPAMHFYGQPTVVDGFDVHRFRAFQVSHFEIPGEPRIAMTGEFP